MKKLTALLTVLLAMLLLGAVSAGADLYIGGYSNSFSVSVDAGSNPTRYPLIVPYSGDYVFYSTGDLDTVGYLYDGNGTELAYNDDYNWPADGRNFRFTYSLTAGEQYYLGVRNYSGAAAYASVHVDQIWTLHNGVLAVNAELGDFAANADSPWYSRRTQINKIILTEKVSSVGNRSFYGCTNLTAVTFLGDVTRIGDYAFYNCAGLGYISLPSGLTSIGSNAFANCTGLTSIDIPAKVTTLGGKAFYNCSGMTYAINHGNITSMGSNAFAGCSRLAHFTNYGDLAVVGSYAFSDCTALTGFTFSAGTKSIGSYAFRNCSTMTAITIPQTVTGIGKYVFQGCTGLRDIYYNGGSYLRWTALETDAPAGAVVHCTHIADGVCENGMAWNLSNEGVLTVSGRGSLPDFAKAGAPWYSYRSQIRQLVLEEGVTGTGSYAFYNCDSLEQVTIPGSVESIGARTFQYCTALRQISIPESVTSIGVRAFDGCTGLTGVTIPGSVASIGSYAFNGCTGLTNVTISGGAAAIGSYAFSGCTGLTNITIPESITSLGSYAFNGCTMLQDIYYDGMPDKWSRFDLSYLSGFTVHYGLGSGYCGENVQWILRMDGTMVLLGTGPMDMYRNMSDTPWYSLNSQIKALIVEDGVTTIGGGTFYGCTNLASVTLGAGITEIGGGSFYNCTGLRSVVIPEGTVSVGAAAFYRCTNLTKLWVPSTLTWIDNSAFSGCGSLKDVFYPGTVDAWGMISMGNSNYMLNEARLHCVPSGSCGENVRWVFRDGTLEITGTGPMEFTDGSAPWLCRCGEDRTMCLCQPLAEECLCREDPGLRLQNQITNALIGEGVTTISAYAFQDCAAMTKIVIPDTITTVGTAAFRNCSALRMVTLRKGVTAIGGSAFRGCTSLTKITIPSTVTGIGSSAFYGCSSLTAVTIPAGVRTIGTTMFWGCSALETLVIPDSVVTIGDRAFYDCSALTVLTIPGEVRSIGSDAFAGCTALGDIYYDNSPQAWADLGMEVLPNTVVHFGLAGSGACGSRLKWQLDLDGVLTVSGTGSMYDYSEGGAPWYAVRNQIRRVVLEEGITRIGAYAFCGCSNLTAADIPGTVTGIGKAAFLSCSALTDVILPEGLVQLEDSAFSRCSSLTRIALPAGVTEVAPFCFDSCTRLKEAELSEYTTGLGQGAFRNCIALINISIPRTATAIAVDSFSGCTGLSDIYFGGSGLEWYDMGVNVPAATRVHCAYFGSGTCGDDLQWELNAQGVLTISGTGSMYDYSSVRAPWYGFTPDLLEVVLEDGVTEISNRAFSNCYRMTGISFSAGVTRIGYSAFDNCVALQDVYYDGDAQDWANTSIDSSNACLTSAQVHYAPSGTCGDGVYWVLRHGTLLEIYGTGPMNFEGTEAPWYELRDQITSVTVAAGVTTIQKKAFHGCSSMISAALPKTVTVIDTNAFRDCTALKSITLPKNLTKLGTSAFNNCGSLYKITIPAGVEKIGDYAFYNCTGLTRVTLSEGTTAIGVNAFYKCTSLTAIELPETVTDIGSKAFYNCSAMTEITIPMSVTAIGEDAFFGCGSIADVYYGGSRMMWDRLNVVDLSGAEIHFRIQFSGTCGDDLEWMLNDEGVLTITGSGSMDDYVFYGNYGTAPWDANRAQIGRVIIGEGVTGIGECAFYACPNLTDVQIPEGVTVIGNYAFSHCTSLARITIPGSLRRLGVNGFYGCGALADAVYGAEAEDWFKLFTAADGNYALRSAALRAGTLTGLLLPDGLTVIEEEAFAGVSAEKIVVPAGVTRIDTGAFRGCTDMQVLEIRSRNCTIAQDILPGGSHVRIRCYANSTAHSWALAQGYTVILLDR